MLSESVAQLDNAEEWKSTNNGEMVFMNVQQTLNDIKWRSRLVSARGIPYSTRTDSIGDQGSIVFDVDINQIKANVPTFSGVLTLHRDDSSNNSSYCHCYCSYCKHNDCNHQH